MAHIVLNGDTTAVIGEFANPQPDFPDYAEVDDTDARVVAFRASLSNPVPSFVTKAQARIALLEAGLLDSVESYIAGLTGTDGKKVQIWYSDAQIFQRQNAMLLSVATALNLSDTQLDGLFTTAFSITP